MPLRFMSFNVRTARARDADNAWPRRRQLAVEAIREADADVVGLQEPVGTQLAEILEDLPRYRAFGRSRRRWGRGEYNPILVDVAGLDVLEGGDFWLSHRPHRPGSVGWDASLPRLCTWLVLRERSGGPRFAVYNTHFDQLGMRSREESARLLASRAHEHAKLPRVVMGDLNALEHSPPLRILAAEGFRDAFRERHPSGDAGTFHRFGALSGGPRIDYILCDDRWRVVDAAISTTSYGGRFPSDHYPVTAVLEPESRAQRSRPGSEGEAVR